MGKAWFSAKSAASSCHGRVLRGWIQSKMLVRGKLYVRANSLSRDLRVDSLGTGKNRAPVVSELPVLPRALGRGTQPTVPSPAAARMLASRCRAECGGASHATLYRDVKFRVPGPAIAKACRQLEKNRQAGLSTTNAASLSVRQLGTPASQSGTVVSDSARSSQRRFCRHFTRNQTPWFPGRLRRVDL